MLLALWDVADPSFGSSKSRGGPGGLLIGYVSAWLFDTFGHWGPRVALIAIGTLFVGASLWLASAARQDEGPSDITFSVLSWTLILLVSSLLIFIVVGPLLRNPTVDGVLSHWREWYYAPTVFLAFVFALGLGLRWTWQDYRETGDPWNLLRVLFYLVFAIIFFICFLLISGQAIFGIA